MGGKIGIIVIAVAGAIGLIWLFGALSKNNAIASASSPGVTPLTPINPIPGQKTAFASIPILGSIFSAFSNLGASPSPVSPAVITATPASIAAGVVPAVQGQGPSYSQFLGQQTDAAISATSNAGAIGEGYNPNLAPPSLIIPQTALDTSALFPAPDGVMPPGISTDASDYSGTGDAFYS